MVRSWVTARGNCPDSAPWVNVCDTWYFSIFLILTPSLQSVKGHSYNFLFGHKDLSSFLPFGYYYCIWWNIAVCTWKMPSFAICCRDAESREVVKVIWPRKRTQEKLGWTWSQLQLLLSVQSHNPNSITSLCPVWQR